MKWLFSRRERGGRKEKWWKMKIRKRSSAAKATKAIAKMESDIVGYGSMAACKAMNGGLHPFDVRYRIEKLVRRGRWGRWGVMRGKIALGGFSKILEAHDCVADMNIVLKTYREEKKVKRSILEREYTILKELAHSNIVKVFNFCVVEDFKYIIMEKIEGVNLTKKVANDVRFKQFDTRGNGDAGMLHIKRRQGLHFIFT